MVPSTNNTADILFRHHTLRSVASVCSKFLLSAAATSHPFRICNKRDNTNASRCLCCLLLAPPHPLGLCNKTDVVGGFVKQGIWNKELSPKNAKSGNEVSYRSVMTHKGTWNSDGSCISATHQYQCTFYLVVGALIT